MLIHSAAPVFGRVVGLVEAVETAGDDTGSLGLVVAVAVGLTVAIEAGVALGFTVGAGVEVAVGLGETVGFPAL
jgi:hypothetical protein